MNCPLLFRSAFAIAATVVCWLGGEASAATIVGQVSFTGTVTMDEPLSTATVFTSFSNVQVDAGVGDYETPTLVPLNTAVTVSSFTFTPFTSPVEPLWSFSVGATTYSLDLTTLSVTRTTLGPNTFLNLGGTGTASISGFDDTSADFIFTAQQAVGAVGTTITFSAEAVVPSTSVPEPAVPAALLLAGFFASIRRRRA